MGTGRQHEIQGVVEDAYQAIRDANAALGRLGSGFRIVEALEVQQVDPERPAPVPDPPIPNMAGTTGNICPTCQSPNVQRRGGCEVCADCGESVGGCG